MDRQWGEERQMTSLNQVEQLLKDVESLPLSKTLPSVLPLALECRDYKGYCVLSHLILPVVDNPQTNTIQSNEIIRVLLLQGLPKETVSKIILESREEFLSLKTVAEDQIASHSIKEMEDWLPEAKEVLGAATYVVKESYQELTLRVTQIRRLYESIRGYVITKLTYYQQAIKTMKKQDTKLEQAPKEVKEIDMKKVFIVHGHNGEIKEAVARLIEKQGIQAIILHEQANQGATIIEKFERYSDVGCAVCLFTADDLGRAKNDVEEKSRARQNVVFETGYFIGKLGRNRVVLIADKGVEIPSDLQGVVYTETNGWQYSVLKELKAIGYNVDYNKLD